MPEGCTTLLSRWLLGLSGQCDVVLFCLTDASKPLTFKSFLLHSNHVFLGRPLGLLPVTIVLSTFFGHVSGSIRWRWLCQRRRPSLSTLCYIVVHCVSLLHRPNRILSSSDDILSVSFCEQIHLIIIISLRLRRETSSCFASHVSQAYSKTLHTCIVGITTRFQRKTTVTEKWQYA